MSGEEKLRDYLKKATGELQVTNRRLRELEQRDREPIAIVGMSCRFPGGANSPEQFWRLLARGGDGITKFPEDRGWDLEGIYDPDPEAAGKTYIREGGFLHGGVAFDPAFFGISPREALAMDPQQRLLLEGAWEALEDAGIDPAELRGSDTGVFAGMSVVNLGDQSSTTTELGGYLLTGFTPSVASGRVAYALGLEGPAMTIDTACSSSLVAMHLAAGALRGGECGLALAGGVTVMSTPDPLIEFSRQRVPASDARCKSFSSSADGAGFSEGVGLLLLERLSDAQRNGHRILAVVKGSATNQDGASNGLTAPNGPSQERVIRQALANAGLKPQEVDAVEAHGTGTTLGDPIEARALLATYGQERESGPLALGSLKSNVGHAQAAAGVGGVIKMVLALREEALPKTLHVEEPTPHVDWESGAVELLTEQRPWPKGERPRRAGVSSFGISGTNAHLIIEEAPEQPTAPEPTKERPPVLPWALSAKTPEALAEAAGRLAAQVEARDPDPLDVAHSLLASRAQLEHRAVVVGSDREELLAGLDALAQGKPSAALARARATGAPKVAFVLPGQGSQWQGMASDLLEESPPFAESIARCQAALAPYIDFAVAEVLGGAEGAPSLEQIEVVQPVLFAVAIALAELWRSYGVQPAAVIGHSQGEIAAAVIAGALTLDEGAKLAALRSAAISTLRGQGAMVSVALSAEAVAEWIEPCGEGAVVAAVNSPATVALACSAEAIPELLERFEAGGVRARAVAATIPSHSHHVEPLREQVLETFADLAPQEAEIPFYSTVSGEPISGAELDAEYWYRNLREPVRFHEATRRLLQDGFGAFVEVSPHPVLAMAIGQSAEAGGHEQTATLGTLRREEGGLRRLLTSLAEAHAHGIAVDWGTLFEGTGAAVVDLPTYPFQRERYWLEVGGGAGNVPSLGQSAAEHPLLGAAIALAGEGTLLTGRISLATHPWLADHAVAGTPILPGTGFVELALRAGREVGAPRLRELILQAPLVLPAEGAVQLQVSVGAAEDGESFELEIHSRVEPGPEQEGEEAEDGEQGEWIRHASGSLGAEEPGACDFDATAWPPAGAEVVETGAFYDLIAAIGFDYGPAFQGLEQAWKLGEEVYAEISLAAEQAPEAGKFGIHPALLDACLHAGLLGADPSGGVRLPFSFTGVSLHEGAGAGALRVRVSGGAEKLRFEAADGDGVPVASIAGLSARAVDPAQLGAAAPRREDLFGLERVELKLPEAAAEEGEVEVFECVPAAQLDPAAAAHALCAEVLERLQAAIAADDGPRLAFLTRGGVALETGESADPAAAAAWGLVRSAQSEHPGRFSLIDSDGSEASREALPAALAIAEEPQLALREGKALAPRLAPAAASEELALPAEPWRLAGGAGGTLEELAPLPNPEATQPLAGAEVRLGVHSAGVNFRDVLVSLGMGAGMGADTIGSEGAGVVLEVGPEVEDLAPGDRVFGFLKDAFAPLTVTNRAAIAPLPEDWSFDQGAAAPIVFGTAYYGLVEIAALEAGQRVLIHAGAGGVGIAAIRLAQHLGAEVFATASPSKWETLRGLGLDEDHIASSRTLDFKEKFLASTGGEGVDVVLNSLAREFVDASLELLPRGGHFLEMGKTDLRDAGEVTAAHDGVAYRAFSLGDERSPAFGRVLEELLSLDADGTFAHSPIDPWDARDARAAFRYMSQARHVGKVVLRLPQAPDPAGTVLVTGGLSGLGVLTARHLASEHGVKHLLLSSRRGAEAPGAAELVAELAELGCEATAVACDVSDRDQVEALLNAVPAAHPLTAVYHSAVVLDDGVIESLDHARLDAVLAPKADGAWHLHELTRELHLSRFVLFSSAAAIFGSPGQGNYAAANSFLDALAQRRRAEGLAGTAIAWGLWEQETESTAHLGEEELARLAGAGVIPLASARGLELLDLAGAQAAPLAVAVPLDAAALRAGAAAGMLPPLLSGLVASGRRRAQTGTGSLARRLAAVPEAEREGVVLALVQEHAAAVLGHSGAAAIESTTSFKDLGFDSLGAVELRNRLAQASGVKLEGTLVFDYPTPTAVAAHLLGLVAGAAPTTVAVRAARGSDEPIAIVGMSCRYPGGAGSPRGLWDLLARGGDGIAEFPADRGWDIDSLYDPDPERAGTIYTRHGGLMSGAGEFDPGFFGIGPNEALAMDPQQRLLLEGAWEALEDAGIDPGSLRGSPTGVFVGISSQDYAGADSASATNAELEGLWMIGHLTSVASGRIAYTLGLEGPAMTIDTACSSSLVALHLAGQALRGGECGLVLAGGATVMATPRGFVEMGHQGGLAPDGRCKSFDADADGIGFSEGVGLLLLERLSDAQRNGHRVLATIKGSATNQDGASNGLTAPNGPSQERVIRQALANAGLKPSDVDAVEAHGTGTTLGDPIEAGALLATYGQERGENGPLQLGSMKSNIGHAQAAAGVGGVIKMVMALQNEALPKTLHVEEPTPHVDWESGEIELLSEQREWPKGERPRRAGVSSFGISGTNAHVILEEAPEQPTAPEPTKERPPVLPWALSAKTPEALAEAAGRLAAQVEADDLDPLDVAHSLLASRAQLEHRAVLVGGGSEELLAGLDALAQGKGAQTLVTARKATGPTAFLFSGQGSQQPEMGKGLYESFPVYAAAFDSACAALEAELGLSVKDAVFAEPGSEGAESLERTDLTQASLFALQVALFRLVDSFGIAPDYLLGHSIGEISAAHLAGVLSLEDAAKLVAARGRLMAALPAGGAMASVRASEQDVIESLASYEGRLNVAAINTPSSITVSGDEDALSEWEATQEEAGKKVKRLQVSHAFHSHRMEPMLEEFEALASTLTFNAPQIPVISNLSGEPLSEEQAGSPSYWSSHVREAVRFADGVAHLQAQGTTAYLELGPDAILTALAAEALRDEDEDTQPVLAAALRRERPDAHSFLLGLGAMHAGGAAVDFAPLLEGTGATAVELPTYPFQRQRFWLEMSAGAGDLGAAGQSAAEHPMLGAAIDLAGEGTLLTGRISLATHPWLADHVVAGTPIVPGTAFVELALRAGREVGAPHLRELVFEAPLALPAEGAVQLQVSVSAEEGDDEHRVAIHSRPEAGEEQPWTRHAGGTLSAADPAFAGFDVDVWPPAGAEPLEIGSFYDLVAESGVELGPAFQGLEAAWKLGEETYAEIALAAEQEPEAERFGLHPALLDAALHPGLFGIEAADSQGVRVLFSVSGLSLREGAGAAALRVRVSPEGGMIRIDAVDPDGAPALSLANAAVRPLDPAQLGAGAAKPDALFAQRWAEIELSEPVGAEARIEVFECVPPASADPAAAAHALCAEVLERLQAAIAAGEEIRLAIVTTGAMAREAGESADPAAAAVWGLVRSAQSEQPGRFLLVDTDGSEASREALAAALAIADEPQLALREGKALAPRLARAEEGGAEAPALDPEGTVLISGGLSGLGALTARHLASEHGVQHLLLAGRRGADTPGAAELLAELAELGCEATALACDVSDRDQVAALLAAVPAEHPLTAIVHSAGAIDDGVIEALDPERLDIVFAPKADAAWHLHELTREMELAAFVLFSSVAAGFGSPGQGNYAAANSFLDALAQRRRAEGLAATAIAWGMWEAGMGADLSEADRARVGRSGIVPLAPAEGLDLFDRARAGVEPLAFAVPLDKAALRSAAGAGMLPPLFSGLVKVNRRRARAASGSLARRLATVPEAERETTVLALVREQAADVLGTTAAAVDPGASFKDLGFDSLGAVELRNRLTQATGIQIEATLVFDHPTPKAVAAYLLEQVEGDVGEAVVVHAARGSDEPIAIVGMSCRYPGAVASPRGLWELVAAGRDVVSEFPADRGWDLEGIYDPDPEALGKTYSREGGFISTATEFDPGFFGIAPNEALAMDPQQRLLLEGAWEALEDVGIDPAGLRGSATGVFAGMTAGSLNDQAFGSAELGGYLLTGLTPSVASGRIAYALGLEGPTMTVDTACSSSLVAMHLAGQALRGGECDLALAGGVTALSTPDSFLGFAAQRVLSPDGRCKSFAADADGTGFSEGLGLLVLERLSDAQRNGHRILAVVKGSATNQDGASNGLTAPNGPSQERVIRQALANAGLKPSDVDAVEAHGTGTTLGDPIEAQALLATYGQERESGPLALGSFKSNVGHTQAAAGVGGVIKMVMALREEALPRTLHVDEPSPHVDWSAGEIELLSEQREWRRSERPRRAGVSSFGISGTNVHLILEEAPEQPTAPEPTKERPPVLPWALSAKTPEALAEAAGRLAAQVEADDLDPLDVAHSLLASRAQLEHRAVLVGADQAELLAGLDALAQGKGAQTLVTARKATGPTAFLFSGQGSQQPEMGKGLYESFPVFAAAFDGACAALEAELGLSVKDAVFAEPGSEGAESLERTDLTQASLFALQVALFELLTSFGIAPDHLLGHSIGEISAAHLAGVLSLEDAAKLVAARGRLMAALPAGGAMASVRASEQDVIESLASYEGRLNVAAINTPSSITVSGDEDALSEWEAAMEAAGKKVKRLQVSHAFHSHRMEPMLEEFEALASTLTFNAPQIPVISNLSGEPLSEEQAGSPSYWSSHVREAVRFADGVAHLQAQGTTAYLELGPDAILTALAAEALRDEDEDTQPVLAAALRRERPDAHSFLLGLGAMHAGGAAVDFSSLLEGTGATAVELPTYPFQRQRFWLEMSAGAGDLGAAGQSAAEHPMLGAAIDLAGEGTLLTGRISLATHPWLADHVVAGTPIVPGTAFVELALRAGREVGAPHLRELVFEAPLALPADGAVQLQVSVSAEEGDDEYRVAIHSRPEAGEEQPWTRHAGGTLSAADPAFAGFDVDVWPPAGAEPLEIGSFYDDLAGGGLELGPAFQGLEGAWKLGEETYGEIALAAEQSGEAPRFGLHPALLDAALHPAALDAEPSTQGVTILFSFGGVSLHEGAGAAGLRVRIRRDGDRVQLDAVDQKGTAVVSVAAVSARAIDPAQLPGAAAAAGEALLRVEWVEVAPPATDAEAAVEVFECASPAGLDPAAATRALCLQALERLQAAITDADDSRLAFLTTGAMATDGVEAPDPAAAAVWGLVRSAQSEHPGRFLLIDSDGSEASREALAAALAIADEPQLALREGALRAPRLAKAVAAPEAEPTPLDPEATVLISGGLTGLGALTARHLASEHGVKHLLLSSRRGAEAPGAAELLAELAALGCEATAVACDVSDRDQVAALLADIPAAHPLSAVIHCAGLLEDATIATLDPTRFDAVLAPKADGAWHLHELTREMELTDFVLFSSIAANFGSPGQGNYAAANAFLEALAQRRRAEGLPATAIAWGLWEQEQGIAAGLGEADRARLGRTGLTPLEPTQGLELLDRARAGSDPLVVAVPLDKVALRTAAAAGMLPPLFSGLVKVNRRRAAAASGSLARRLATVPVAEREAAVLALVREHTADVLGHPTAAAVDPGASFKDLGFDSLGAVELRNRLTQATGIQIEATLVFDHPTPKAVAAYLLEQVEGDVGEAVVVHAARGSDEPIAIVGMSCRFPGGANSPEQFWRLLARGGDGITKFPEDRGWDLEGIYDPDPEAAGKTYIREGGFLHGGVAFDPAFFGISPREALAMDPQQRLLLEGAWEALEDAGIDPAELRGSDTGVFAGMSASNGDQSAAATELGGYLLTGFIPSVASGRVAYALGLEGPAMTIDTACSSSLVAMHLAAGALRGGECGLALAGGVTMIATPGSLIEFSRQRVPASDARCKSFSSSADGAGFSEGVGLLLLERLSDAQRNGHRILAVVKGSATNQDGASNGLTAPNGPSQERVIRQALANAGLKPSDVDAVEAHGTGTTLGDPIEAQALLATYGQERESGPLALGSLKSNVGHAQAAAGVGGVIKMVLALREEALPKTLHVEEPTPHVDWESGAVELLTEQRPWPKGERPRRAGVSSFGISGTNAHLIIEEAPEQPTAPEPTKERPPVLPWALSAKTPEALAEAAGRLAAQVEARDPDPLDVAHSLLASRAQLEHRAVVVGSDREELLAGLDALAQGKPSAALARARATGAPKVAFVLPGQGSQWQGMASDLLEESPPFAESIARCQAALAPYIDFAVAEVLGGAEGAPSLEQIEVVQPVLFAVAIALAELWRSYGVQPAAVIGHSQGEIAAAVIAGALTLDEGAKLAALRSAAISTLRGQGAMVSVALSAEAVAEWIEPCGEGAVVAAVNSPATVALACSAEAIPELLERFEAGGVRARAVAATIPSHSHHVEPLREQVLETFADLAPQEAEIPFYSTVSGEPISGAELDAEYWYRNLREPVRFHEATRRLLQDGFGAFVEVSPHPVLAMAIGQSAEAGGHEQTATLGTLRREEGGLRRLLTSLAEAHAHGIAVDWGTLFEGTGAAVVDLPTYPFQRERYWLEVGGGAGNVPSLGQSAAEHPLLGAAIALAGEGTLLTGRISLATHPWLADHAVAGTPILPGTGFVELALRAGREVGAPRLRELILQAPLVLPAEGAVQLQVSVGAAEDGESFELEIHSRVEPGPEQEGEEAEDGEQGEWIRHASGSLGAEEPGACDFDATAWPPAGAEVVETGAFYDLIAAIGFDYGPAFQGLEQAWKLGEEVYAEISLAAEQAPEAGKFGIHPALLDACLHAGLLGIDTAEAGGVRMPFSFTGVSLHEGAGASALRIRVAGEGEKMRLDAFDQGGVPVVSIELLSGREIDPAQLGATATTTPDSLLRFTWTEVELDAAIVVDATDIEVVECVSAAGVDPIAATHALCAEVLERLQAAIASKDRTRLAFLTRGAVALESVEPADPAAAAAWGLVRSAQSEHPGRFLLVDSDGSEASREALAAALAITGEPQLALREGAARAPRLARAAESEELHPPSATEPWRLEAGSGGTLEEVAVIPAPKAARPLAGTEVRVDVRATALNFRDVLISLGMYPAEATIGCEGAGVVREVGPEVEDLAPGDHVFGFMSDSFGPLAVADRGLLARLPEEWSFAEGSSVTIVYVTAYYGLVDLANLQPGERVLIHAGAGGVGIAAIRLAQHLGAEVFATASPSKWETLRGLGLDDDHIASSRTLDFREKFLATTEGEGVDVVLNALVREFVDASLDLMPRGGRFMEMGKTDLRDPEQVAGDHPGLEYCVFDLYHAGPERTGEILAELLSLFASGALSHSPITTWDVRDGRAALRYMSQARHVGKLVLTIPQPPDPDGTVLVTGGLSGLGALSARHLAGAHGTRRLLLAGRRGPAAPGAEELIAELAALGCEAEAVACDVSDRRQLQALLAAIPAERPLTAVVHCAGAIDDGLIEALDPARLDAVLAPKADGAWHLHELTRDLELSSFVLFSSAAASFGGPGQGNYAAANSFLDGLAQRRRAEGLPATAIAWGLWEQESVLSAGADRERMAQLGLTPIETGEGLELLDRARLQAESLVVAVPLQTATLSMAASAGVLPPLLSDLVKAGRRRRSKGSAGSLARRLANVPEEEREAFVLGLVREHTAAILGHSSVGAVDPAANFKDLGFDSLGAVELRNRLAQTTGIELEATLVFDYPTSEAISRYLLERAGPGAGDGGADPVEAEIRRLVAAIPAVQMRDAGVLDLLRALEGGDSPDLEANGEQSAIDTMDIDSLVRQTLEVETTED